VFEARELQRAAERRHQEAGFALTTCTNKIKELGETLARIDQEIADDETRLTQAREELARLPADALDAELQTGTHRCAPKPKPRWLPRATRWKA
jgi:chromosome segregation protein